jgi:WD40 repeat protein
MLPEFSCLHTLGISQAKITAVAVDPHGEWIAFGCKSLGQILVWEWKSESYILKQQGHHYDINALSYSLDSQFIATGAQVYNYWLILSGRKGEAMERSVRFLLRDFHSAYRWSD